MHPLPVFAWQDEAALRAFVAARAFAHLLAVAADGSPLVAHVPVVVRPDGTLRFHLARGNRIAAALDGARGIASIAGEDGYVSPDWYGAPDQVPTWNYRAVEVEGRLRLLDEAALVEQLDALSAMHEAMLAPKPAWTRAKMGPGRFEARLGGILCFELADTVWRGTAKLSQNKTAGQRAGVAAGLAAAGQPALAALIPA